jgi:indole-3-glycerol phosphate synthase
MILDDILARTRQTVAAAKERLPWAALEQQAAAAPPPRDFWGSLRTRLTPAGVSCISEIKRRSPSAGWIREGADPAVIAAAYEAAGAAALSVLTDEPFFGGTLEDLRRARAAVAIPVLRKDFIVDRYQVVEARAAGADAILLIVAALRDEEIVALSAEAARWGLDVLVEAHDAREVRRALDASARIVGINHRDLRTFEVDTTLAARLRPSISRDRLVVAESGIKTRADVLGLRAAGIDAILVGETLMRAPDPGAALAELTGPPP